MKTEFAIEKSEYAHLLNKLLNDIHEFHDYDFTLDRIKAVEKIVKFQGDELMFIVTTVKTNPMNDKSAPPMSQEDIENANLKDERGSD